MMGFEPGIYFLFDGFGGAGFQIRVPKPDHGLAIFGRHGSGYRIAPVDFINIAIGA